jgi:hypothetical protein
VAVREAERRAAAGHPPLCLGVEQEQAGQQPAARRQQPRRLGEVVLDLGRLHVGEDRAQEHQVEPGVVERQPHRQRVERSAGVVLGVGDVEQGEPALRPQRGDLAPAPVDRRRHHVEPLVAAGEAEPAGQPHRQPAEAAPQVEHRAVHRQRGEVAAVAGEALAEFQVVPAVVDVVEVDGGHRQRRRLDGGRPPGHRPASRSPP